MTKKLALCAALSAALGVSAAVPVVPSDVTGGRFADNTNWYTMQIAAAGFYLHDQGSANHIDLTRTTSDLADADLWCFSGSEADGFTVYNLAAGAGKSLAAPSSPAGSDNGGSAFPTLKAPGQAGQTYLWDFSVSSNLNKPAWYINEHGAAANKINNRGNKLAFWTSGADAGSSVVVTPVYFAVAGEVSGNSIVLNADPAVSISGPSAPVVNADGSITLGEGEWMFSTPEGKSVSAYSLTTADGKTVSMTGHAYGNDEVPVTGPVTIKSLRFTVGDTQERPLGEVVFRYDRTPDYNICYRIPTIVKVQAGPHKGRLVAINDYRYSGVDIGGGRIDLYMSVSDDNGKTWSTPDHMRGANGEPVAKGTGAATPEGTLGVVTNLDCGFGDPATVSDRETGEILAIACCGRKNFWAGRREDPQPSARWWSNDGGQTWTEPDYGQWEQIYALFDGTCQNGYIDSQFVGSGRMVQSSRIKVGSHYRIYCVMSGYHAASGNVSNWVLYSDDFGHNWHVLGDPMNPAVGSGADEPKCEELPDGSVLLAARGNSGNRNFNIFRYTDIAKAEGRWGNHINTNLGNANAINACNGEIMIVPVKNKETGAKAFMALQSYPAGPGRANVSIAWKVLAEAADYDEPSDFANWNGYFQVSKIGSAYSTMTLTEDNAIGFIYEEETFGTAYSEIYRHLTIEEITADQWEYLDEPTEGMKVEQTKEMVSNRLAEVAGNGGNSGNIVGQISAEGIALVQNAADAYLANPSDEAYTAFNDAIINNPNVILPEAGKLYTFRSMHGGLSGYPTKDRWLAATTTKLSISSKNTGEQIRFRLDAVEGSDNFHIYSPMRDRYLAATPEAAETAIDVKASIAEAAEYTFDIADGTVAIVCTTPGNESRSAVHMKGTGSIVTWTPSAAASRWEMALYDDEQDSISEIVTEGTSEVRYFDLQGRPVAAPRRGQLLITSDRRKVIF